MQLLLLYVIVCLLLFIVIVCYCIIVTFAICLRLSIYAWFSVKRKPTLTASMRSQLEPLQILVHQGKQLYTLEAVLVVCSLAGVNDITQSVFDACRASVLQKFELAVEHDDTQSSRTTTTSSTPSPATLRSVATPRIVVTVSDDEEDDEPLPSMQSLQSEQSQQLVPSCCAEARSLRSMNMLCRPADQFQLESMTSESLVGAVITRDTYIDMLKDELASALLAAKNRCTLYMSMTQLLNYKMYHYSIDSVMHVIVSVTL
jgi:hypothetical protein